MYFIRKNWFSARVVKAFSSSELKSILIFFVTHHHTSRAGQGGTVDPRLVDRRKPADCIEIDSADNFRVRGKSGWDNVEPEDRKLANPLCGASQRDSRGLR